MKKKLQRFERLGEQYIEAQHESGLKIMICPKPDFTSSYALFGTRYGSTDTLFRLQGEDEFSSIPFSYMSRSGVCSSSSTCIS